MKQYIGTKIIEAEPAYRCMDGQGHITITDDPSEAFPNFPSVEDGYRVRYADGYVSWSPKDTFERAYLPLEVNTELRTSKPSISQEMVDNFILETWTQTAGEKTTIVRAMLRNGFELVEASSCVSPENYDEKLGREICMKKIKDRSSRWWTVRLYAMMGTLAGKEPGARPASQNTWCRKSTSFSLTMKMLRPSSSK